MTPKELQTIISTAEQSIAATAHELELFEAAIEYKQSAKTLGQEKLRQDLETYRQRYRQVSNSMRAKINIFKQLLKRDKTVNGWKGEDRAVQLDI